MPSPLAQAGATVEPSEYSSLTMDEMFTGIWTQRNPLRDADVPYLYRKFYSASRFDSMIDGINREISARLTDVRRPGSSVYNDQALPGINRFYPFRTFTNSAETIHVIADCQGSPGTVRDVTGPHNNITLRTKSAGAGKTTFLGVGNILYAADGVSTWKLVLAANKTWQPSTAYNAGDLIVDSNGNIQRAVGFQTANITHISVAVLTFGTNHYYTVNVFLDPTTPLNVPNGVELTLGGLTTVPWMNGFNFFNPISPTEVSIVINSGTVHPAVPYSPETGTATTGVSNSGPTPPTWATGIGQVTQDSGGAQWVNMGTGVQNWGGAAPATAPTVTQVPAPTLGLANWAHDTWYAPLFVIVDSNGNLQQLTTAGTTGAAAPVWATTAGATTPETSPGTAVWTCKGPSAWAPSTAYALNAVIQATFTYSITVPVYTIIGYNPYTNQPIYGYVQQTQNITVTCIFQCSVAGTSGAAPPFWVNGLGTIVTETTGVGWTNRGTAQTWTGIGASQNLSLATKIVTTMPPGIIENVQTFGKSGPGPAEPTWTAGQGSTTIDNTENWLNAGPYAAANTGAWIWAYSGLNTLTGEITNPSPVSQPLVVGASMQPVIQGSGLADTQFDKIILWRTAQNGSTLFYDDEFANPGAGQTWTYTDTTPDQLLNTQMAAPGYAGTPATAGLTTPPPSTAVAPEFHCGRIWMINGLDVIYSGGPDTLVGSGNSAFPPLNFYQLPEQPVRLKSVTTSGGGLIVACVANTYIILGEGTASSPFLPPKMFMEGVGLQSYDCLCMRGSTLYGFSNKAKCFSFDPGNGEIEIGFPVGDQFKLVTTGGISTKLYDPSTAYITWHEENSTDTGLYVADGTVGWFRWSPIAPPESGSLWSPRAAIVPGTSAVQSVETSPGKFQLLIGPHASGPILYRDNSVTGDWNAGAYAGYPSWDVKGSIGLCETGEVAEIAHVALKSIATGARPVVSLLLDEIAAGVTVEGRTTAWDILNFDEGHHEDPPNLDPSITIFSDRYKTSSTPECPKCENFQLRVDYGIQQAADELLKFGVYGATFKERRQQ